MGHTAIILSGGGPPPSSDSLPRADLVVAADSGVHLAEPLGLHVDLIVGDLDSADAGTIATAVAGGATLDQHPADKDATDLELAMEAAVGRGADHLVVVGAGAGRLDHLLGVALLLSSPRWVDVQVEWRTDDAVGHVVRGHRVVAARPGDLVSVLPVTPTATVSISGTRWELDAAQLGFGTTRGMSNVAVAAAVAVDVSDGAVLAVHSPQP